FSFQYYLLPYYLHAFPTRRSSDLDFCRRSQKRCRRDHSVPVLCGHYGNGGCFWTVCYSSRVYDLDFHTRDRRLAVVSRHSTLERSEEHTSELQSRFDLVCRLLLEK